MIEIIHVSREEEQRQDAAEMAPPTKDKLVSAIWDGRDKAARRHGDEVHADIVTIYIVREVNKLWGKK